MNEIFLNALKGNNHDGPPVWLMRQAGRHMSAYRNLRKQYSFLQMCHEPDLITKVTCLPIEQYNLDAAIVFSDILMIPEALGVGLSFKDGIGPIIKYPIKNKKDILNLPHIPNPQSLQFIAQGISQLKACLKVPLIGFCGAPFTVASYMIEGKSSINLKKTKQWMLKDPESFHHLLKIILDWTISYALIQISSGVNVIQIFDSWAHTLSHYAFREFSLEYLRLFMEGIKHTNIPTIFFCRGSSVFATQISEIKPSAISLDWNCHLKQIRSLVPSITLQGNLDPDILYAPHFTLVNEIERLLNDMEGDKAFIFNLGHGILPDTSEEAVRTLVSLVKKRQKCQS